MGESGAVWLVATGACTFGCAYGLLDEATWQLVRSFVGSMSALLARAGPLRDRGRAVDGNPGRQVMREMPMFLDIVTLGLSAGLSFDSSLELYCSRSETLLSARMSNAMLAWRMGVTGRAEALEQLARDVGDASMERFASTVSEALAFGTPLAQALERQAELIRAEQRARMEEEIERVPVKMLIPLGTLIVPAMLLAILGPLLGPALGVA